TPSRIAMGRRPSKIPVGWIAVGRSGPDIACARSPGGAPRAARREGITPFARDPGARRGGARAPTLRRWSVGASRREAFMVTGGCLCGAVGYEIDGRISGIWYCHCSKCRKVTGSAFHPGALCRRAAFRWTRGEEEVAEYRSSSGYTTRFCRRCGSPAPSFLPGGESVVL